jgi:8-oxo-dGTP diphosphatase
VDYQRPNVAVDLAVLSVIEGTLKVLLMRRDDAPVKGWAMPGGFVHIDASLDETVARVLHDKTKLTDIHFEQLATYGAVDRDPRERVISVVYMALCPADKLLASIDGDAGQVLAGLSGPDGTPTGPGGLLPLAFDHQMILGDVVTRLRGKLDYSAIGFALLPDLFTLRDAQIVHEAILGHPLTKPAFRRKLMDRGLIAPTGTFEQGRAYRPAELYQVKTEK